MINKKKNRVCTVCSQEKVASEFGIHKDRKDGIATSCKECNRAAAIKYRNENLEEARARERDYHSRNKEQRNAKSKIRGARWRKNNQDHIKNTQAKYVKANPKKVKETKKNWKLRNIGRVNADTAARRAAKLRAIPLWVNKKLVKEFYVKAREIGMEVDHVIPLRSKTVCGLHWEGNLQLLLPKQNASKGNKYETTT